MRADQIDRVSRCIHLRWQKTLGKDGNLVPGKEFGLIPVEGTRWRVQLVQRNTTTPKIDKEDPRGVNHFKVSNSTLCLENELFYVHLVFDKDLGKAEYTETDNDCEEWNRLISENRPSMLSVVRHMAACVINLRETRRAWEWAWSCWILATVCRTAVIFPPVGVVSLLLRLCPLSDCNMKRLLWLRGTWTVTLGVRSIFCVCGLACASKELYCILRKVDA